MSVLIAKGLASEDVALPLEKGGYALAVLYGDELIHFTRLPRKSKVNRILIKVHPDCRVYVQAPSSATDEEVISAVKKRARWVTSQLDHFKSLTAYLTPRQYVSGEGHFYLGRQYQLKVKVSPDEKQGVKLFRGSLVVSVRDKSSDRVRKLLIDWYKGKAREIFLKRLAEMLPKTLWVNEEPPITIRTMQTQWGSCSPSGRLTLNPHLVKASRECIDYVILHELCHIAEHNHSDRFYRLMKQVMPEWEEVKDRLDKSAATILNGV